MNRKDARAQYERDLKAGYTPDEAKDRLMHSVKTGISLPDPTDKYWDALIGQESGGNQAAVSPKGATGIAQVMPATGPEAAALAGVEWDPVAFKNNKVYNARLGRAYFRKQMADNNGDPALALAAYNAGPGAVRKAGGDLSQLPAETQNYVPSIMNKADQGMQPDLDNPADVAQAQEALMSPRDRARKAYEDAISQGASPDQAKAAAMQFAKATPAPVVEPPPPAAEVAPPSAARGLNPISNNDPMVQKLRKSDSDIIEEQLQGNMGQRFAAGLNESFSGIDRGARKLLGQLLGNDEAVAKSESETQKIRQIIEQYDPTGSGISATDIGKLTGDVGSFAAAPAGGATALGRVAMGTGLGALQGVLQPTTADESQGANALVGGVVGGTASGLGNLLRKAVGTPDADRALSADLLRQSGVKVPAGQEYKSPIGGLLRRAGGAEGSLATSDNTATATLAKSLGMDTDITNAGLEANLRRLGPKIGDAHLGFEATPDRKLFRDLLEVGRKYQLSGPISKGDEVGNMIDHLMNLSKPGNKISGEEYQALRSGLTADSVKGSAAQKTANTGMKRALDRLFSEQNPQPDLPEMRSQYRLSKILRSGSGVPAEGFTAKSLRNRVEGAAGKGEVRADARTIVNEIGNLLPGARVGGETVGGAASDTALRGIERPSVMGALSAILRAGASPASKAFDTGVPHKIVNDEATRRALANLLRGLIIPPATPKGEQ